MLGSEIFDFHYYYSLPEFKEFKSNQTVLHDVHYKIYMILVLGK